MPGSTFPQWFVSDGTCALCDSERHLAHSVNIGAQWYAFDATRPNGQGAGWLFLGSFARRLTAMETAESETLHLADPIVISSVAAHSPGSRRASALITRDSLGRQSAHNRA